jgi:histidine triad (HIT) family protein
VAKQDCLFCKIAAKEIKADVVMSDNHIGAFRDTNPQAPTHVLIVPTRHISTINDLEVADAELVGKLFLAARQIARDEGLSEKGYRVTMNCMEGAGQSVFHIHLHLLGGRKFGWPPR